MGSIELGIESGVVDQAIDTAKPVSNPSHQLPHRVRSGNIDFDGHAFSTGKPIYHCLGGIHVDIGNDDSRALFGKGRRIVTAKQSRPPRQNDDGSFEIIFRH